MDDNIGFKSGSDINLLRFFRFADDGGDDDDDDILHDTTCIHVQFPYS